MIGRLLCALGWHRWANDWPTILHKSIKYGERGGQICLRCGRVR